MHFRFDRQVEFREYYYPTDICSQTVSCIWSVCYRFVSSISAISSDATPVRVGQVRWVLMLNEYCYLCFSSWQEFSHSSSCDSHHPKSQEGMGGEGKRFSGPMSNCFLRPCLYCLWFPIDLPRPVPLWWREYAVRRSIEEVGLLYFSFPFSFPFLSLPLLSFPPFLSYAIPPPFSFPLEVGPLTTVRRSVSFYSGVRGRAQVRGRAPAPAEIEFSAF